jgi:FkbM family methyltransferase
MTKFLNSIYIVIILVSRKLGFFKKKCNDFFNCKRILESNYKIKSNFKFIQVGANDGISFDFLYDFVVNRNSIGIVIEPIKEYFEKLESNYSKFEKIIKVNKGVHSILSEIKIYKVDECAYERYPEWVRGIASFDSQHHKKLNINSNDIIEIIVECDTLMNIIFNNSVDNNFDYFQIDTEGFDYEVIKMIDFSIIKPSIIRYEHKNLGEYEKLEATKILRNNGYFIFNESEDTIAIYLNKIKLWK